MTGGKVDGKYPPKSWKIRVTQSFDVYLYFQEGIIAEDDEELHDILCEEAANAAFGEDGLTAVQHEDTESQNGYLAYVETLEPDSRVLYITDEVPSVIKQELHKLGFVKNE